MKINLRQSITKVSYYTTRIFRRYFSNNIYLDENGFLSDKYYNINLPVNKITDELEAFESSSSLSKDENLYESAKKIIFPSEDHEKKFLIDKTQQFNIPVEAYRKFLDKGMVGDAVKLTQGKLTIYLIGTIYERINVVNIYKMLNYVKPDYIMIQVKPDRLLTNIDSYYGDEDKLCEKLTRDAWEVQPSLKLKEKMRSKLVKRGFIIPSNEDNSILQQQREFRQITYKERITNEAISMISFYGEQKGTKIILSDINERYLIERISNTLSLMQIRQMFESIFTEFPNNPDWEPYTAVGMAINLYPDVFLTPTDVFVSQLLNKFSSNLNEEKTVVVFTGYGQTFSIPFYLKYDRNSLNSITTTPKRYKSLIQGEDILEVLVEKWTLLFLIINGVEFKSQHGFQIVENLMTRYAREEMITTGFNDESYLINRMAHLFDSLLKEKRAEAIELIAKGFENKKKLYMRKIFNDPVLNSQLL